MGFPPSEVEKCPEGPSAHSEVVHYLLYLIFQEVMVWEVVKLGQVFFLTFLAVPQAVRDHYVCHHQL